MEAVRAFIERKLADRRQRDLVTASLVATETELRRRQYTGETRTIWAQGVPKEIRVPNDLVIHLER
jgi:hypothetical protein